MLSRVDEYILDRLQRVSDCLQSAVGWDCLTQSNLLSVPTSIALLWMVVEHQQRLHSFDWISAILLLAHVHRAFHGKFSDNEIRRDAQMGLRNRRKITDRTVRIVYLALLPIQPLCLVYWASAVFVGGIYLALWLTACDPRPPQTSKVRQWLKSLSAMPHRTPAAQEAA